MLTDLVILGKFFVPPSLLWNVGNITGRCIHFLLLRFTTNLVSVNINTEMSGIKQHNCVSSRPPWVRSAAHCGAYATYVLAPDLEGLKSRCRRGTSSSGVLTRERSAAKLLWVISWWLSDWGSPLAGDCNAGHSQRLEAACCSCPTAPSACGLSLKAGGEPSHTWSFLSQAPSF